MITFNEFGFLGRLGNQLFQYSSILGFCRKYNCDYLLPNWKYVDYFEGKFNLGSVNVDVTIRERSFHYTPEAYDSCADLFQSSNVDLIGYWQTEKYWLHCKDEIFRNLNFKKEFEFTIAKNARQSICPDLFDKPVIAVHVRRGDYVNHPCYHNLSIEYYCDALDMYGDWRNKFNVLFFSDEISWCENYFKGFKNCFFVKDLNEIESLCLMTLCTHYIIANSSYSWWGAYLGQNKSHGTVIRPINHFEGDLKRDNNIKDLYPEDWVIL